MHNTLTLTGVAAFLGVSRQTLYNMLTDGRFPLESIPGSRPRRWSKEAVAAWVAGEIDEAPEL